MEPQQQPLARVYQEHRVPLRKKLLHQGVRFSDVDDVLHQVFAELHRDLGRDFTRPNNLVAWVYAAAHHKAIDYIRHHRVREELHAHGDADALIDEVASPSLDAAQQLLDEERRRFLREALQRMSPGPRAVLEHRIYYELTVAQTAQALDLSEATVRARFDAGWRELEAAYARWRAENERRCGFLVLPLTLVDLLGHGSISDAEAATGGGWPPPWASQEPIAAAPMGSASQDNLSSIGRGSRTRRAARRRTALASIALFLSGGIVGAAALWLFLHAADLLAPPLHLRAEELGWILSMTTPPAALGEATELPDAASIPEPARETSAAHARVKFLPLSGVAAADRRPRVDIKPHDEESLLKAAEAAIAEARFAEARSFLMQHATRFPHGPLAGVRDAMLAGLPK